MFIRAALTASVLGGLVACETPSAPHTIDASSSSLAVAGCPGNSGGACDMTVTVLVTSANGASLVVRTGSYNENTNIQTPDGTFDKVQVKISNAAGKLVSTKNYDASGTVFRTPLDVWGIGYSVAVQANINDHAGKKGKAVVRSSGVGGTYAPDIDVKAAQLQMLVGGVAAPLRNVLRDAPATYTVTLSNLTTVGGNASTTGISVKCVVSVDNVVQVEGAGGFSFVGPSSFYIAPGTSVPCTFTKPLAEGTHNVTVTATPIDGFVDANPANNSSTSKVVASPPADVSVQRFVRLEGTSEIAGSDLGSVLANSTQTFSAWITSPAGSVPADATCSIAISPDVGASAINWISSQVHLDGGETKECQVKVTFAQAGAYSVAVSATSAGDPNPVNNLASATMTVLPPAPPNRTIDLRTSLDNPADINNGTTPVYEATISVNGGTQSSGTYNCVATVSGATATTMTPISMSGTAAVGVPGKCRFSISGMSTDGNTDRSYQITVKAVATDANELTEPDNSQTIVQNVIVRTDLAFDKAQMSVGSGSLGDVTQLKRGQTGHYVVTFKNISTVPVASYTCLVTAASGDNLPGTISATAGGVPVQPNGFASCTFDREFTSLEVVNFNVAIAATSPIDGDLANNATAFATTSTSDNTFPNITATNVHIFQDYVTDTDTSKVLLVKGYSTDITRITLTFTQTKAIIGDFKLSGMVQSNGNTLSSATLDAPQLKPGTSHDVPFCIKGVDAGAQSVFPQDFTLAVCAAPLASDPTTQEIFIEYQSVLQSPVFDPSPTGLFGGSAVFTVNLDWKLAGSTVADHADAVLNFNIRTTQTDPNAFYKLQEGTVSVIRNGGA